MCLKGIVDNLKLDPQSATLKKNDNINKMSCLIAQIYVTTIRI